MGEGRALFPHPRPQAWGMMPVALGSMPLVLHGPRAVCWKICQSESGPAHPCRLPGAPVLAFTRERGLELQRPVMKINISVIIYHKIE